jgi:hypothetical protein
MVTIDAAIRKGRITLMLPIVLITVVLAIGVYVIPRFVFGIHPQPVILISASAFVGLLPSWLWWSIMEPKWKIWAYESIDPAYVMALKQRAISNGLIWPDGSIFNKTEIWSKEDHAKMLEIARRYPQGFKWR